MRKIALMFLLITAILQGCSESNQGQSANFSQDAEDAEVDARTRRTTVRMHRM
jgi:hypothetical protein